MARNKYPEVTVKKIVDAAGRLFANKGYEGTSIQDIIGLLGGLSKGAIYHHFHSKEEILYAVLDEMTRERGEMMESVRNDASLNGLQKLQKLMDKTEDDSQEQVFALSLDMMKNPKMLAFQLRDSVEEIAPNWVYPILLQGMEDGSLPHIPYPKELAECFMLLSNIWLNPMVCPATPDEVEQKCRFLQHLLKSLGIEAVLISEDTIRVLRRYTALHQQHAS